MDFNSIRSVIDDDMQAVNRFIHECLKSDVALVNQLSLYIVNSGGKRLRPILVLLAAGACGYRGQQHINLAATIEFIHTATLLHDDVVDESDMRRGNETANAIWGNAASVLVGDFLYSRAFQMMVEVDSMEIMRIMADTTNIIAEGEVLQLAHCHDADVSEERYMKVIRYKTAKLFQAGCSIGAVLAERPEWRDAMSEYGMQLGIAFQLVDDALDYHGNSDDTGKNVGDDLAEGKLTMPLLYALHNSPEDKAAILRKAIEEAGLDYIDEVLAAIKATGAIEYTIERAKDASANAIKALEPINDSQFKQAMTDLATFVVDRDF